MYCLLSTGEKQSWKFIKVHILRHIPHHLLKFGWWENCSCQTGEQLHKVYLHMIKRLTNNKADWERQIFRIHKREQGLRHIIAEVGEYSMCTVCVQCTILTSLVLLQYRSSDCSGKRISKAQRRRRGGGQVFGSRQAQL